jgi:hypothetical protein
VTLNTVVAEWVVDVELPLAGRAVTVTLYLPVLLLRSVNVALTVPLALTVTDELDSVAVTCDGAFTDSATVPLQPPVDVNVTATPTEEPTAAPDELGTVIEYAGGGGGGGPPLPHE